MPKPLFKRGCTREWKKDMLNRRDIEATLRALLMQFHPSSDVDTERIVRFAQAGAEALQMQTRMDTWLDSATSAELLHLTADELRTLVASDVLPGTRSASGEPWFHRRDVCLYWLSQQLGSMGPLVPLGAWRDEDDVLGFDPWGEATPG
jgi:hypothetical protein